MARWHPRLRHPSSDSLSDRITLQFATDILINIFSLSGGIFVNYVITITSHSTFLSCIFMITCLRL